MTSQEQILSSTKKSLSTDMHTDDRLMIKSFELEKGPFTLKLVTVSSEQLDLIGYSTFFLMLNDYEFVRFV